jgi:hypothetical protein
MDRGEDRRATAEPEQPRAVFLSCLGTTNYRPLRYAPHAGEPELQENPETRFVQVARLKALRQRQVPVQEAFVLVTEEARTRNWQDYEWPAPPPGAPAQGPTRTDGLETCLKEAVLQATPVRIPDGRTPEEFWQIFQTVAERVPPGADICSLPRPSPLRLTSDVTLHGVVSEKETGGES